ncbi:hypothetical protein EDC01DRAFT_630635 [Geopyxis carbonaria]|nr:hypothetical protein EDC01DRAFT_630635 [Geopyxis carbonaria]
MYCQVKSAPVHNSHSGGPSRLSGLDIAKPSPNHRIPPTPILAVESSSPPTPSALNSSVRGCPRRHSYSRCTRRCQLAPVESAYAVSTLFFGQGLPTPIFIPKMHPPVSTCTRRSSPRVRLPYAAESSSPPTLHRRVRVLESAYPTPSGPSRRVRLRRQHSIRQSGVAYADIHTQDAPAGVNLHPSSPPTLSALYSSAKGCLRRQSYSIQRQCRVAPVGRVLESAYPTPPSRRVRLPYAAEAESPSPPTLSALYSSARGCLHRYSYPRCTRRCQLAPAGRVFESAYPTPPSPSPRVRLPYAAESESSNPPTLRRRVRVLESAYPTALPLSFSYIEELFSCNCVPFTASQNRAR